jgi:hypothetical protein
VRFERQILKWTFIAFALFLGVLHVCTARIGVKRARLTTRFSEGLVGGPTNAHAQLWGPGFVRVDFEKGFGGFNSSGGTDYYIWLFGWQRRIWWARWAS